MTNIHVMYMERKFYLGNLDQSVSLEEALRSAAITPHKNLAGVFPTKQALEIIDKLQTLREQQEFRTALLASVTAIGTEPIGNREYLTVAEQIQLIAEHKLQIKWIIYDDLEDEDANEPMICQVKDKKNNYAHAEYENDTAKGRAEALAKALLKYSNQMVTQDVEKEIGTVQGRR